ncbi:MAG: adenylate/guanylate cyclase domain-containing protein [Candidatus Woesebacteria bacterium]|jgi:CHASE2 domain-containing sensor protein/class 3 adenylate cyclase
MSRYGHLKIIFYLLTTFFVFVILLLFFQPFYNLNNKINDLFYSSTNQKSEIVIVAIDDLSLQTVQAWPWSAEKQAELINIIKEQHPKLIAYAASYPSPDVEEQVVLSKLNEIDNLVMSKVNNFYLGPKGHLDLEKSSDGKVRQILTEKNLFPSFSLVSAEVLNYTMTETHLNINYRFKTGSLLQLSAQDIFSGRNLIKLKDKIVLIDLVNADSSMDVETPLGLMKPIEVQANAIDTVLSLRALRKLPKSQETIIALFLAILPLFLAKFIRIKQWLGSAIFLLLGIVLIAFLAFRFFYIITPVFYWLLLILFGVLLAIFIKWKLKNLTQVLLKKIFGNTVSPEVLSTLLKNPEKVSLQGEKLELTVLFVRIKNFSDFVEKNDAKTTVSKLKNFLETCTDIVISHQGTIDKYSRNTIIAFWGAPLSDKQQASKACVTALEIQDRIGEESQLELSIGISYGLATVASLELEGLDYSAIGETVDQAIMLESATQELKQTMLVSESVVKKNKEENSDFRFTKLKAIKVEGSRKSVKAYGLEG